MGREFTGYFKMATSQITDGLINDSSSPCFKKEVFMKEHFSVDKFVSEHRKNATLETLREDISTYLRVLRLAMIELINQDYADFVNLSSNLAGLDKSINNLSVPLGQLREEVLAVQATFSDALATAQKQLNRKQEIKTRKMVLQRVLAIVEGVNQLEELCQKSLFLSEDKEKLQHACENMERKPGEIIERIATELSQVDNHLKKTPHFPIIKQLMPRLEAVRGALHSQLEKSFLCALEDPSGRESLRSVLRASTCIDHIGALQDLFLRKVVRPYMMEVISERVLHQKGLEHIYSEILDFINQKCNHLLDTSFSVESSCETRLAFSFLISVVWPEVASCLESRITSVFSPGHPAQFQRHYLASHAFLQRLYAVCPTEAILRQLKHTATHSAFLAKWNLPVYYQIRFQEIAGALEMAFTTPFQEIGSESLFCLKCSHVLHHSLNQCWNRDVHLDALSHRFWKLNLQLISRYIYWVEKVISGAQESSQVEAKSNSQDVLNNGMIDGTTTHNSEPEPTVKHLVMLVTDLQRLHSKVSLFFSEVVQPVIITQGFREMDCLKGSLDEYTLQLEAMPDKVSTLLISRLVSQCSTHLKMAVEIPRLYRKTNREVPTKASTYVGLIFQPLETFETVHGKQIPESLWSRWRFTLGEQVTEHYLTVTRDVLHSVKKMEDSLKRLKKVRTATTAGAAVIASGVVSDDDKIRIQFAIDVQTFGLKMDSLNMQSSSLSSYSQLVELVESARNTPNS